MLYATDGIASDEDFNKAMVGVASVWCVPGFVSLLSRSHPFCAQGMKATRESPWPPYATHFLTIFGANQM